MSSVTLSDIAVLIPSYQPDNRLLAYVEELKTAGLEAIVIVDDGSGTDYDPIFENLKDENAVIVCRYTQNKGKGYALRLGMETILARCPDCAFVITADSDGQHTVKDILRMADELGKDSSGMILGTRDFSAPDVPPKSRAGNRITSKVFRVLYGKKVEDTQTGLRGFSRDLIPQFLKTKGDRYEFEMNQLINCAIDGIPMRALPIETVYENNNENSHFRAFADSFKIYRVIFSSFTRFALSSGLSFLVDYGLYLLLNHLLKLYVPALDVYVRFIFLRFMARIVVASGAARAVSATLNYWVNKKIVFNHHADIVKSFSRYIGTVVLIVLLSAGIISTLHIAFDMNESLIKIPVDIALFCLSYFLQRKWVFGGGKKPVVQQSETKDKETI